MFAPLSLLYDDHITTRQTGLSLNDLTIATKYLQQFYSHQREPPARRRRSRQSLSSKLKDMQNFFGLNPTGHLDLDTLEVMMTPRCGVSDVDDYGDNAGNKWKKNILYYSIGKYTNDLPASTVDSLLASALDVWAKESPLTFYRTYSDKADIMVEFASYEHGDSYPFDGPQGILAHAFGPGEGTGGDIHFDEDEFWTDGSKGFNLYLVAVHEFGHALGLRHSQNPASIMYPMYTYKKSLNSLSSEDIMNINALYGPRNSTRHSSTLAWNSFYNPWISGSHPSSLVQDKCSPNLSFDAVVILGEAIFFFKDRYLWIKQNNLNDIKEGAISNFMPKIDTEIDAAYWVPKRSTAYLFSGPSFWIVKGSQIKGRPKNIASFGFPSWVQELDAAVHIRRTAHTLFFTQEFYWRFNESRRAMDDMHPRSIREDFPGICIPVSAAVHRDSFLYFFCGSEVYKYDSALKKVIGVYKANSWLNC
ncbi:matrix metalloproteinase-20 [Chanos chanos]|uniref:Matrix metalloproteinase-20 n=1 Tax=Chanos chanos TaxID=29144 RepID=A0A6J2VPJ7_CHACN|nr:matrix metalloproteinase-20-like [Chanos chanos]